MLKGYNFILILVTITFFYGSVCRADYMLESPDKKIIVSFYLDSDGSPVYSVAYSNLTVLKNSTLGIIRRDENFSSDLSLDSASGISFLSDKYNLLHGKKSAYTYTCNRRTYYLRNDNSKKFEIIFQVSNDGVAFRYRFPGVSTEIKTIIKEVTSYVFAVGTKTWIQPMAEAKTGWNRTNPSYEEYYDQAIDITGLRYNKAGWVYPALFNYKNIWMCISETAPYRDYCGTRLMHEPGSFEFTVGFPSQKETLNEKEGANPNYLLPWSSPWRILAVGDDLADITESTLGTDLAKPSVLDDVSFVKPGRSSWSWVMLKDDSTIYEVQRKFIDYASEMNWEYCLIDAFWNKQIGYDSVKVLADYAATKNVGLFLWYNSAGSWNTTPLEPRDLMLTKESREKEFTRLKNMGIKGVKVDFFGGDGQDVMSYYLDIIEDAAKYGILVNTHGCTLPRGWQRTYPNLLTMEAVRGEEYCTFSQDNADRQPAHCCMLPFARNVFDPMDFTPTVLDEIPNIKRVTTNSFELALPVLFLSGIQHFAETAAGIKKVPDYIKQYLKEIPVSWDETRFVTGYPGKLIVIARRAGSTWYVAGINGENQEKKLTLDLSFIENESGSLISDVTNRQTKFENIKLSGDKKIIINLLANGGFVTKFVRQQQVK